MTEKSPRPARHERRWYAAVLLCLCLWPIAPARGEAPVEADPPAEETDWTYGAYLDLSYPLNFNFPDNHLWRSRSTVPRNNELTPNMALAYVRKTASRLSPWGMELAVQGGYDSKDFAYLPGEPRVSGADTLRHIGLANLSYVAPIGNGLKVTGGLFNSFLGAETLWAKDNVTYTRSWTADYSPYLMFGVNAQYPLNDRVTLSAFVVNSYAHLSRPNDQPNYGVQAAYVAPHGVSLTHTLYAGPVQSSTSTEFWRYYLNNIVSWERGPLLLMLTYDIGTEQIAGRPGAPQAFAMGGNLTARWRFAPQWYAAVRPEFYWDRNGRWTGSEQFVKAMTTTLDYAPFHEGGVLRNSHVRLEHRWDESTGVDGGFFKRGDVAPGVPGVTGSQHLVILALLMTFDSL